MKAMILAAGFGTRLRPYTNYTPKSLFSIAGRPILDILIQRLQHAGCTAVMINTHHLHHKIETFVAEQKYSLPVHTRYEPQILGTGGGIKNVTDFWDDRPFLVVNGDIVTDIDLKQVYEFHCNHRHPVTLVLYDDPKFNSVSLDQDGFITGFQNQCIASNSPVAKKLTFTGIQVIDPEVLEYIPQNSRSSIIAAYKKLTSDGRKLKALVPERTLWKDIGTPQRYKQAVINATTPIAFRKAFPQEAAADITRQKLKGDGSTRQWYRLRSGARSLIMVDHGVRKQNMTCEIDAFVNIGRHLRYRGLPVPRIYFEDTFSGLVFLEDLGDTNLQAVVRTSQAPEQIRAWYERVIYYLVKLSLEAATGFDPAWTYQTPRYSKEMILENECRYFVQAFLNGYLGLDARFEDFQSEFHLLADKALEFASIGFMHRDMQSRNIMVRDDEIYFIDFQGGRLGPIQYDLASLLLDPYVELPHAIQKHLLNYGIETLSAKRRVDSDQFRTCYRHCALARNLQILGAFGYLSTITGKGYFEDYIPAAVRSLTHNLTCCGDLTFPILTKAVERISENLMTKPSEVDDEPD